MTDEGIYTGENLRLTKSELIKRTYIAGRSVVVALTSQMLHPIPSAVATLQDPNT